MTLKKINDIVINICRHPEHNPPSMIVLPPGTYQHECPKCHKTITFNIYPKYC